MKTDTAWIKILSIALLLITLSCSVDHGIEPLPGKLEVKVIFYGDPPPTTEGVYLIVAPEFPPHAINELYQSPNSLPLGVDTVYTEMALPYGHYDALALWWYNRNTKSNLADILALPLDPDNSLVPKGFDISSNQPLVQRTLYADWSRMHRDSEIKGTLTFNGPFPPNTLAVAVAAFFAEPKEGMHFLVWLKSIDFSVDSNPYEYTLPVTRGSVGYIGVFFLAERAALTDFKTIGVYMDPNNPDKPGKLSLKSGETLTGIDIDADWGLLDEQ